MNKERKIGEYTVRSSLYMGEKEYALCENLNDPHGLFYMTCTVTSNDFFEFYSDVLSSDDYLEIAGIFADRVKFAIEKQAEKQAEYPRKMITAEMCEAVSDKNLQGEIIVIKADVFHPEFRTQAHQIVLCKGGNGASAGARGHAVFCEYLTDCHRTRFERTDVLGILKKEHYPEWVSKRAEVINEFRGNPDVFEYGSKRFLGVGQLPPLRQRNLKTDLRQDVSMTFETHNGNELDYNYNNFMNAAKGSPCDIFKCYENGKLYIPGQSELFNYTGQYRGLNEQPQLKKKEHKEMER